jgi:hypothetical protein
VLIDAAARPMTWGLLAAVGVPLWLCAAGILTLVLRNRALRHRPGNIACRLRVTPGGRWTRGHGVWVHDVFAFRGSRAAWKERLLWAIDVEVRPATEDEAKKLRAGRDHPIVVTIVGTPDDGTIEVAAREEDELLLLGPSARLALVRSG